MKALAVVLLGMAAAVVYGVVLDQMTARICVEYFTIGHPPIFRTQDVTLLALCWGVVASWWFGAILGILLACASRMGKSPKIEPGELVRPVGALLLLTGAGAFIAGICGAFAAVQGWVELVPSLAERVPADKHIPFLTNVWIHGASYLLGALGGLMLIRHVLQLRRLRSRCKEQDADFSKQH